MYTHIITYAKYCTLKKCYLEYFFTLDSLNIDEKEIEVKKDGGKFISIEALTSPELNFRKGAREFTF